MDEKKDAKVIPFPKRVPKKVLAEVAKPVGQKIQNSKNDPWYSNKQNMFFVAAGALFVASIAINQTSINSPQNAGRGIASEGSGPSSNDFDKRMARRLANLLPNDDASIGRKPTAIDDLNFGILEGKYSMHFEGGKVDQIQFVRDETRAKEQPYLVADPKEFLKEYQNLFSISFEFVKENTARQLANQSANKTYSLFKGDKEVGTAQFELDSEGRLIKLNLIRGQ